MTELEAILHNMQPWQYKLTLPVMINLFEKFKVKSFCEIGLGPEPGTAGLSTSLLMLYKDVNIIGIDINRLESYTNLENIFPNFKFMQGKSFEVLETLEDHSFDLIYIDGSHHGCDVKLDLEVSVRKCKKDGIVSGHDYGNKTWTEIKPVVDEFVKVNKYDLKLEQYLNYWFVNK